MKKYLFLSLIFIWILVLPVTVFAATIGTITDKIKEQVLLIGTAAVVIGWIITGVLFLTAAGSPDKLSMGKKALIASVAGTIIIIIGRTAEVFIKDTFGL